MRALARPWIPNQFGPPRFTNSGDSISGRYDGGPRGALPTLVHGKGPFGLLARAVSLPGVHETSLVAPDTLAQQADIFSCGRDTPARGGGSLLASTTVD